MPGKPEESLLIKAVRYQDEPRMPPKGKLTDRQIEVLEKWVKLGAPWPGAKESPAPVDGRFVITEKQRRFWSFQPVGRPNVPEIRDHKSQIRNDIDRFILAGLEAKGIAPAAPADKRTLIRRATFDLIGLPPTPAEIDAFLADDSPQAFAKVVDRLLASPLYGERWGRHWLDVVRYADARDLIQLPRESDFREAWRYRDWVVDSFNRDLPYTEFVRSQVAGDLLPSPRPGRINKDGLVATGMLAIADFVPGDVDKNQMIADYVNDQIDVVGRAFLGLSVACARCHDHKFDPISTEDYYALAGIFFSTRIIPGPVPGNTPLVRVPLLSPVEIAQLQAQNRRRHAPPGGTRTAAPRRGRPRLSRLPQKPPHRDSRRATSWRLASAAATAAKPTPAEAAKQHGLHAGVLTEWVAFLDRVEKQPQRRLSACAPRIAAAKLPGAELQKTAQAFQESLAEQAKREEAQTVQSPEKQALTRSATAALSGGRSATRHRRRRPRHALAEPRRVLRGRQSRRFRRTPRSRPPRRSATTPSQSSGSTASRSSKPRDRCPRRARCSSSYQHAATAVTGERIVGWEDADTGQHGLGLMPDTRLDRSTRSSATTASRPTLWTATSRTGSRRSASPGGRAERRCAATASRPRPKKIDGISSDPKITALKIGGPGSGGSPRFHGDIAELRVYNRPADRGRTQAGRSRAARRVVPARRPEEAGPRSARRSVRGIALAARPVLAAAGGAIQATRPRSAEAT